MSNSAFTVSGSSTGTGGAGTVTAVQGTPGQINVTDPTTSPVLSLDSSITSSLSQLQTEIAAVSSGSTWNTGRNRLLNGLGALWQRQASGSASQTFTTTPSTTYVDDMWQIQNPGTPLTVSQVAGLTGAPATAIQIQRTPNATATAPVQYGQTLIPSKTLSFVGQYAVFSFEMQALPNFSGTLSAQIVSGTQASTVSYLGAGFSNPEVLATLTPTLTTSWQRFFVALPAVVAASASQLYVGFTWTPSGTAGAADGFVVSERQFEIGQTPSPYEFSDLITTLQSCQPFYFKSYDLNVAPGTVTGAGFVCTVTSIAAYTGYFAAGYNSVSFPVTMHHAPTMQLFNPTGGANTLSLTSVGRTGFTLANATANTVVTTDGNGNQVTYYTPTTASAFVTADASPA